MPGSVKNATRKCLLWQAFLLLLSFLAVLLVCTKLCKGRWEDNHVDCSGAGVRDGTLAVKSTFRHALAASQQGGDSARLLLDQWERGGYDSKLPASAALQDLLSQGPLCSHCDTFVASAYPDAEPPAVFAWMRPLRLYNVSLFNNILVPEQSAITDEERRRLLWQFQDYLSQPGGPRQEVASILSTFQGWMAGTQGSRQGQPADAVYWTGISGVGVVHYCGTWKSHQPHQPIFQGLVVAVETITQLTVSYCVGYDFHRTSMALASYPLSVYGGVLYAAIRETVVHAIFSTAFPSTIAECQGTAGSVDVANISIAWPGIKQEQAVVARQALLANYSQDQCFSTNSGQEPMLHRSMLGAMLDDTDYPSISGTTTTRVQGQSFSLGWSLFLLPGDVDLWVVLLFPRQRDKGIQVAWLLVLAFVPLWLLFVCSLAKLGDFPREDANKPSHGIEMVAPQSTSYSDRRLWLGRIEVLTQICHDMNAPITAVTGYLDLLRMENLPPQLIGFVEIMARSIKMLSGMLEDLVGLGKLQEGKVELKEENFNLQNHLLRPLEDTLMGPKSAIGRNIELVFDISDDLPPNMHGDVRRLQEILTNLLQNAGKFTESGYILLRMSRRTPEQAHQLLHAGALGTGFLRVSGSTHSSLALSNGSSGPRMSPGSREGHQCKVFGSRISMPIPERLSPVAGRGQDMEGDLHRVNSGLQPYGAQGDRGEGCGPGNELGLGTIYGGRRLSDNTDRMADPATVDHSALDVSLHAPKSAPKGEQWLFRGTGLGVDTFWLAVEVEDSGPGIPEDKWESVFEKYTQVNPQEDGRFGGYGLGLNIVRHLVTMMRGVVKVVPKVAGDYHAVVDPPPERGLRILLAVELGNAVPTPSQGSMLSRADHAGLGLDFSHAGLTGGPPRSNGAVTAGSVLMDLSMHLHSRVEGRVLDAVEGRTVLLAISGRLEAFFVAAWFRKQRLAVEEVSTLVDLLGRLQGGHAPSLMTASTNTFGMQTVAPNMGATVGNDSGPAIDLVLVDDTILAPGLSEQDAYEAVIRNKLEQIKQALPPSAVLVRVAAYTTPRVLEWCGARQARSRGGGGARANRPAPTPGGYTGAARFCRRGIHSAPVQHALERPMSVLATKPLHRFKLMGMLHTLGVSLLYDGDSDRPAQSLASAPHPVTRELSSAGISAGGGGYASQVLVSQVSFPGGLYSTFEQRALEGLHVLLVDDNPMTRRMTEHMLTKLGVRCTEATGGYEALALVQRNHIDGADPYHLILMDCQMPGLDGFQTARAIGAFENAQEKKPLTPIIGHSAHALSDNEKQARDAGMVAYMTKPYNVAYLGLVIKKYAFDPLESGLTNWN
eukprot:jgi/Mesvir1/16794/Mv15163-RA.1